MQMSPGDDLKDFESHEDQIQSPFKHVDFHLELWLNTSSFRNLSFAVFAPVYIYPGSGFSSTRILTTNLSVTFVTMYFTLNRLRIVLNKRNE